MANQLKSELSGSARNFGKNLRSFFANLPGSARGYRSPASGIARNARAIGDFSQPYGYPQPVNLSNAFQPSAEPDQSFFDQPQESQVAIDYGSLPKVQVTTPSLDSPKTSTATPPPLPQRPLLPRGYTPQSAIPGMAVTQFSQLPAEFQGRYRARVGMGLNKGIGEQDAVDFYNKNYQGSITTPGGNRQSPLAPPASFRYVASPPGYVQPVAQTAAQTQQPITSSELASQLEADRLAGRGIYGGPTQQDIEERARAVADESNWNQNTVGLRDFMAGEMSARSEAGRKARRQAMDQSFLSKPMQGGGFSMADREARLSALSPPGQRAQADAEAMERRSRTGTAADEAVRTDRELTMDDIERKAKGRVRDRFAPQERMARMRAGRQAMAMNRMAAEQRAYDMATNPLVNPMLLADNPSAMVAAINAMQDQRRLGFDREQFTEGKSMREAQIAEIQARTGLTKEMGELQRREFEANESQRAAAVELTKAVAANKLAVAQSVRDESKLSQDRLAMEGDLVGAQAEKTRSEAIANKAEAEARSLLADLEVKRFDAEAPMREAQVGTETARGEAIRQAPILERDRFIAEAPMREAQVGTETARGEAIRQEQSLARDQFIAGAGMRSATEAATLAEAQERLAQAGRITAESAMLTDEKQRQIAQLQGSIESLAGANDPQSVAARNRLIAQQMAILGNQAGIGEPSPLLPPSVRQPVAPNPETGMIDTAQVKTKVEQLAAYGLKGQELAAQLEALGIDRASLANFLRNDFRDMRWPRSSGPREYVEAARSLREAFGIKNDMMGYGR